jgi:imidazolonepropionase-like amidohydrolase
MKRRTVLLVLLAVAMAGPEPRPAAAAGGEAKRIAIVHGLILDGRGGPPIEDGNLILHGDGIEAVGPAAATPIPKDAQVLDARGKTVMPGLADLHVHLTGGWDGENTDFLSYQRYLNALLYAGVTTVLDTGNSQPWILQLRQESAQGRLQSPRIYCTGAMIDGSDPAWPDFAYALSSTAQVPAIVQRDKRAGVDLIKGYANLSARFLQRLAEEASRAGLRVVVDQWERNGSPDVARTGIAGFAHLPQREMSAEDVRVLQERRIFVITTLSVYESFARTRFKDLAFVKEPLIADTTPDWVLGDLRAEVGAPLTDKKREEIRVYETQLRDAKAAVRKFDDAGILLAAGTDAPYPGLFQGESLHRELELLVDAGLTPLQAIRAATYDAARLLNAEEIWGSLQPGRRADVLIIAGAPQTTIGDTRKIETVIQKGRILDRKGLRFDPARDPGFRAVPGVFVE